MKNHNQTTNQDVKDTSFDGESENNLELFKRALAEATEAKFRKIEEESKNVQMPPLSKRHKIEMNRIFRECTNGSFLPFPEEEGD